MENLYKQLKGKKIYIASSLDNAAQVSKIRLELVAVGCTVTYDWTQHCQNIATSPDDLKAIACAEALGVTEAEVLVALLPGGRGTHIEIGAALAMGRTVLLCAMDATDFLQNGRHCSFYHHPLVIMHILEAEVVL